MLAQCPQRGAASFLPFVFRVFPLLGGNIQPGLLRPRRAGTYNRVARALIEFETLWHSWGAFALTLGGSAPPTYQPNQRTESFQMHQVLALVRCLRVRAVPRANQLSGNAQQLMLAVGTHVVVLFIAAGV